MTQRHARLVRMIELFEVAKRSHEVRVAQYARELALLSQQESNALGQAGFGDTFDYFLQRQAALRLHSVSATQRTVKQKMERETDRVREIEIRIRAAARALERLNRQMLDQAERRRLEELRIAQQATSASSKLSALRLR